MGKVAPRNGSQLARIAVVGFGLFIMSGNVVRADERPATAEAQAEAAAWVRQAGEARSARRLTEARRLLQRALDLHPAAPTAFNLALVLMEMGRHLQAIERLDALRASAYGELPADKRTAVTELLERARASLASLELVGRGSGRAQVRIDGFAVGRLSSDESIERELDPGNHVVSIAGAFQGSPAERRVDLHPGQRRRLEFELIPPIASTAEISRDSAESSSEGSIWASPVFWSVAGVLVAAAVVVPVAVVLGNRDPDQVVDPVLGNREILRAPR